MKFTHLQLENWRNFLKVDVALQNRVFLIGPNASGKSNLLDVFRFLRDIADEQGGFQRAVLSRKGVSKLRSLHARRQPNIVIDAEMVLDPKKERWRYRLEFAQDFQQRPLVKREQVFCNDKIVLDRPDVDDKKDPERLTQTHLEQVNANKSFRTVADFLAKVRYLHIVPQLIRDPDRSVGRQNDPFGGDFLQQMAKIPARTLNSRLSRIQTALKVAVPNLKELKLERDERGVPHLKGLYEHWRPDAGWQSEDQFSDGTLRLLGLLWVFLDGSAPLLLEEPELSLHTAVVRYLPSMLASLYHRTGRQVLVSSHSADLLNDQGIDPSEVLMLQPTAEGSEIKPASHDLEVRRLVETGMTVGRAALPRTAPPKMEPLLLY